MSFYSKFSEKDLIESYKNQIDYQGKASQDLVEEISRRDSMENFMLKIESQKKLQDERNRLIREIHQHYMAKYSKQECFSLIKSDLLSEKEMEELVNIKYAHIHKNIENLKVDSITLLKAFYAILTSSVISFILLIIAIYKMNFLIAFNFFLLIPVYIINYWITRTIVNKTRENLAVFIATFLATLLDVLYFFLFVSA
jgi:ABC-type multidrug transport system fused ATPase/permease subunit